MDKRVAKEKLEKCCSEILRPVGVRSQHADIVTASLIKANLRGVDSHGISQLPIYVERLNMGGINPNPNIKTISEGPSMALMDGDDGLGIVVGATAMNKSIEKAKSFGIGSVAVRRSNHFGMAAFFSMMALEHGMIGVCMSNSAPFVAPWGGKKPCLGTNPLSVAVPTQTGSPVVLDMATSAAARGKIRLALQKKEEIPEGWALDKQGQMTTDPARALDGCLLPFGGPKGYGIILIIDILCGILTGSNYGPYVIPAYKNVSSPQGTGHFFLSLDIKKFMSLDSFKSRMDQMITEIKRCPPATGVTEILLPGEREFTTEKERLTLGIPVDDTVISKIRELGKAHNVDVDMILELNK